MLLLSVLKDSACLKVKTGIHMLHKLSCRPSYIGLIQGERGKEDYLIKVIVFDLGGMIVNVKNESETPLYSLFTNYPGGNNTEGLLNFRLLRGFETGRISVEEFFKEVSRLLNLEMSLDDFKRSLNNMIGSGDGSIEEIVRDLSGEYVTVLFSNSNPVHFEHIERNYAVIKSFDHLVLSFEIESVKPDNEAYKKMLSYTGVPADKHLFIDDRPENL